MSTLERICAGRLGAGALAAGEPAGSPARKGHQPPDRHSTPGMHLRMDLRMHLSKRAGHAKRALTIINTCTAKMCQNAVIPGPCARQPVSQLPRVRARARPRGAIAALSGSPFRWTVPRAAAIDEARFPIGRERHRWPTGERPRGRPGGLGDAVTGGEDGLCVAFEADAADAEGQWAKRDAQPLLRRRSAADSAKMPVELSGRTAAAT